METSTISFIGGGNMAASLVGGLLNGGLPRDRIRVADPAPDRRQDMAERFGVATFAGNLEASRGAAVVVLAVKPQQVHGVCTELASVQERPLVLSIAAGVRATDIGRWLGGGAAVVRAMPNTPALLGCGATGLYASPAATEEQRDLAESILRAVGITLWVDDEAQMDAVTALSGSGPAYFFLLMELMAQSGERMGLAPETARLLVMETAFGAAKMSMESPDGPAALRARVTSPGGTTERAVARMEADGLREVIAGALEAARDRARELGDDLGRH